MTEVPAIVVQAAAALGLDPAGLHGLPGASGSSWGAGSAVLRVGRRVLLDRELAAAGAAAAVLPVPRVLDRADFADHSTLLLERLPGRPAGELAVDGAAQARAAGRACGRVYDLLARVPAPAGLGRAGRRLVGNRPAGRSPGPGPRLGLPVHAHRPGQPVPPGRAGTRPPHARPAGLTGR